MVSSHEIIEMLNCQQSLACKCRTEKTPLNQTIKEQFELEGTFEGHLVPSTFNDQGHLQLNGNPQSPVQPNLACSHKGRVRAELPNQAVTVICSLII